MRELEALDTLMKRPESESYATPRIAAYLFCDLMRKNKHERAQAWLEPFSSGRPSEENAAFIMAIRYYTTTFRTLKLPKRRTDNLSRLYEFAAAHNAFFQSN